MISKGKGPELPLSGLSEAGGLKVLKGRIIIGCVRAGREAA